MEVRRGEPIWALGLMSGTSLDGVDAALLLTDGESIEAFGPSGFTPFDRLGATALPPIMDDPLRHWRGARDDDRARLEAAEREVVRLHARAVVDLLADGAEPPALVGFPGQTVAHYPEKRWTWQLGDGARLAAALNRAVAWDFRTADIEAGGQGAPLAPFFHLAAARWAGLEGPVAFVNVGGVGNVTWVDPARDEAALVAFDTGPGNALLNDWMQARTGQPVDADGAVAARGAVHEAPFATNFVADYLQRPGPKSLDRNTFGTLLERVAHLGTEDGAASLTAFTARCIAASLPHLPEPPARWLACGGGRRNPTMMAMTSDALGAPVEPVEAVGLDGDMLEAQAFAYLAVRVARGLPLSAPGTTGVPRAMGGGRLSPPPPPPGD